MYKILEARIRAQGIESRPQQDARVKSLLVAFLKPIHGLIVITDRCIDHSDLSSIRVTGF